MAILGAVDATRNSEQTGHPLALTCAIPERRTLRRAALRPAPSVLGSRGDVEPGTDMKGDNRG